MSESVTVRFSETGRVVVEGLDGLSYSEVVITEDFTRFRIKGHTLRVGFRSVELLFEGTAVYRQEW